MSSTGPRLPGVVIGVLLAVLLLLSACGAGEGEALAEPAVHHPLAVTIAKVQSRLSGLSTVDAESIRAFTRYAEPGVAPFELRRICRLAGKGLKDSSAQTIADFVYAAADWLYDDFFKSIDEARLEAIASCLRDRQGVGEIDRLRMEAIIRRGSAVYDGTLSKALSVVPFNEAVAPRALPLQEILPEDGDTPGAFVGAAEILRLEEFVVEGAQWDLAAETCRQALRKWPGDPVLVAGLVSLLIENEDRYGDDLNFQLKKAESLDPTNAAWPCLRAARAFRTGQDEEALEALRIAVERPILTFRTIDRTRMAAQRLEALGYGPVRARLTAYRAASMACWFTLKDMTNRAVQRSYEFETSGREKDLEFVLELPRILDRQIRSAPRTVSGEIMRGTILATGLTRLAEHHRTKNPAASQNLFDQSAVAEARVQAIESATETYGGQMAWGRFYDALGEKGFLEYVDNVLYGDEAEFLVQCAAADDFQASVKLARKGFRFQ